MQFYIWLTLAGMIGVLVAAVIYLSHRILRKKDLFLMQQKQNLQEDLELATSDQLLGELRKRHGCPYLLLSPINHDGQEGLSIEIHNIPPAACLMMLQAAAHATSQEIQSRLPNPFDSDDKPWK